VFLNGVRSRTNDDLILPVEMGRIVRPGYGAGAQLQHYWVLKQESRRRKHGLIRYENPHSPFHVGLGGQSRGAVSLSLSKYKDLSGHVSFSGLVVVTVGAGRIACWDSLVGSGIVYEIRRTVKGKLGRAS
jgi:hypothetical protein